MTVDTDPDLAAAFERYGAITEMTDLRTGRRYRWEPGEDIWVRTDTPASLTSTTEGVNR